MTSLCLIVALLVAPIGPLTRAASALTADDKARAEATALEAKFKFKAEDYSGAAKLFLQAFAVSHAPALLYNAARAFEEAGKLKQARAAFEQYLTVRGVTAAGRHDAKTKITALNKRIDAAAATAATAKQAAAGVAGSKGAATAKAAPQATTAAPQATTATPQARTGAAAVAPTTTATTARQATPNDGGTHTRLTWGLLGGGGTLTLIGLLMMASGAKAQATANETTKWGAEGAKAAYLSASDSASATWGAGFLLMLAGASAAGWGVVRWRGESASRARVTWTPALLRNQGPGDAVPGLLVGGHF